VRLSALDLDAYALLELPGASPLVCLLSAAAFSLLQGLWSCGTQSPLGQSRSRVRARRLSPLPPHQEVTALLRLCLGPALSQVNGVSTSGAMLARRSDAMFARYSEAVLARHSEAVLARHVPRPRWLAVPEIMCCFCSGAALALRSGAALALRSGVMLARVRGGEGCGSGTSSPVSLKEWKFRR
jgi:hypothetical protein